MKKRKSPVASSLVRNSKAAIIAAIEIHNKPLFPYRYEVCTLLVVNAWELLLKAYIYRFQKGVNLFRKDGTTKPFEECVACVASNSGKEFQVIQESLERLYEYRNSVVHYYSDGLDLILYSLLKANIVFYSDFIKKYFKFDLSKETNLILLPIGFSQPYSPIDFLFTDSSFLANSSEEVKRFIKGIIESSQRLKSAGIEDSILVEYRMNLTNEKRIKNADIIAGISNAQPSSNVILIQNSLENVRFSNDISAKEIRISEDSVYKTIFTERYADVIREAKERFVDFRQDKKFHALMAKFKKDESICKSRYLDPINPQSGSARKYFYSKDIYDRLAEYYQSTREDGRL